MPSLRLSSNLSAKKAKCICQRRLFQLNKHSTPYVEKKQKKPALKPGWWELCRHQHPLFLRAALKTKLEGASTSTEPPVCV
ncbi:hypothetical protein LDENG_00102900 [Lucifuga dentata]|nr:hypothetical protein LDENG_00102900 [Lucifuga dentata]